MNKLNWGFGARNPLVNVSVFNHHDAEPYAELLTVEELTTVVPGSVQDVVCLCYCKHKSKRRDVAKAWRLYCQNDVRSIFSESQHNEEAMSRAGSVTGTPMSVLKLVTPVTVVRAGDPMATQPDSGAESASKRPRTLFQE